MGASPTFIEEPGSLRGFRVELESDDAKRTDLLLLDRWRYSLSSGRMLVMRGGAISSAFPIIIRNDQ